MIMKYLRTLIALPSKRLSPPEKVEYKAAENEFTSEGAPPPPKPPQAGAAAGDVAKIPREKPRY